MQGGGEGPLHSKQDGGCVFPARTSRSPSFVFMQTFSLFLLLTDKTRTAVKEIYLIRVFSLFLSETFQCSLYLAIFLSFYFSQQ